MTTTASSARERRTRIQKHVVYGHGPYRGNAILENVSRTGAMMRLDRPMQADVRLQVTFTSPLEAGRCHEVDARVAWCQHAPDGQGYLAGLEIRREAPEAALAFAALGYPLVREWNSVAGKWVGATRWTTLEAAGAVQHAQAARETAWQAV